MCIQFELVSTRKRDDFDLAIYLEKSMEVIVFVDDRLDGLTIHNLPDDKRLQLAGACLHQAIEHAQAIVVLVHVGLYGSAFALQRILFEAFVRGLWLRYVATDTQLNNVKKDRFPTVNEIIANFSPLGEMKESLSCLKTELWERLCSYTHTGSEQIFARLSSDGLKSNYERAEIEMALRYSDMIHLSVGIELALAANNESLAEEFLERMNLYE